MHSPIITPTNGTDGDLPPGRDIGATEPVADFKLIRIAQPAWARAAVEDRLRVLRDVRTGLAASATAFAHIARAETSQQIAEVISSQLLPLADACRFLEKQAATLLRPQSLSRKGQPFWLHGVAAEIHREPCGIILVVAPGNYPFFLPGVVMMQAVAAGNAVLVKPGPGGAKAAQALANLLSASGLPPHLVTVLPEDAASVRHSIKSGVDKVVFIGSAANGRNLMHELADHFVPAVMELSGCDAMFVREDADLTLAARALLFGLRLNQGATCIAPRRVFVAKARLEEFEARVLAESLNVASWRVPPERAERFMDPVNEATAKGARILLGRAGEKHDVLAPVIVGDANTSMRLLREDHFSALAAIVGVKDDEEALCANQQCPYALGASVFSQDEATARNLAARINAGTIVINDVIVPTADPRVPFGGRRQSGFGVTRGAEGLLELTIPKVVLNRHGRWRPHYESSVPADGELFTHYLGMVHGATLWARTKSAWSLVRTACERRKQ